MLVFLPGLVVCRKKQKIFEKENPIFKNTIETCSSLDIWECIKVTGLSKCSFNEVVYIKIKYNGSGNNWSG